MTYLTWFVRWICLKNFSNVKTRCWNKNLKRVIQLIRILKRGGWLRKKTDRHLIWNLCWSRRQMFNCCNQLKLISNELWRKISKGSWRKKGRGNWKWMRKGKWRLSRWSCKAFVLGTKMILMYRVCIQVIDNCIFQKNL